jgi:2-isopropylmalate synthase
MHAAGISADERTFEHVDPAVVGNDRDVLISELAGRQSILAKAAQAGIATDGELAQRIVERVKELEHGGFQFEAADGSFELLLRKEAGDYEPLFRLESWRVLVEKRADGKVDTEATIKIWLGGERYVRTAEGNGPVNALDKALREAIGEIYPHLRDIHLENFKVRILDESKGTGAVTRVLIDASDGNDTWGSIGVSENLIAASWDALVDSLEYGMQRGRGASSEGVEELPSPGTV